jgi:hypothetical protein
MPYVLDANTLIQAKNEYYAFDICPGFWDWIDTATASGDVSSIEPIADELRKGKDDLATWAAARRGTFFQPLDATAHAEMTTVAAWVQNRTFGTMPSASSSPEPTRSSSPLRRRTA